jgi:hypothetical protein
VKYHVCHRLIQFTAICETREDAETILCALHHYFGGRSGFIETRPEAGETCIPCPCPAVAEPAPAEEQRCTGD